MQAAGPDHSHVSQNEFASSLFSALQRIGKPISAKSLRSALPKLFQRPQAEVISALEHLVSERKAFKIGAAKPPAYSSTDPEAAARRVLIEELERGPASAIELGARLKVEVPGYPPKPLLARLVVEQRIHPRYKMSKAGRPTKTVEGFALGPPPPPPPPPRILANEQIVRALEGEALTTAVLKERVTARIAGLKPAEFNEALAELIAQGRVHPHRALKNGLPAGKVTAYALSPQAPPAPAAFLSRAIDELRAAIAAAGAFHLSPISVVAELVRASSLDPSAVWAELVKKSAPTPEADEQRLLSKLRDLVAAERAGALIPIRRLRSALQFDPARFDALVLGLARSGSVILHHHDLPGHLSPSERAELVVDSYGTHYVGIALPRST